MHVYCSVHVRLNVLYKLYVTLEHKNSHSNSQQCIVWVKIIIFYFLSKIIRILRSCSMKIFCKCPTVNISKLNFGLVICIAKNLIWTTLKEICDTIVVSQTNIGQTIHQWKDYVFSFQMMYKSQFWKIDPYDWICASTGCSNYTREVEWMQSAAGLRKCFISIHSSIKHKSSFSSVQFKPSWSVSH